MEKIAALIIWSIVVLTVLAPFYIKADSGDRKKYFLLYILVLLLAIKRSIE